MSPVFVIADNIYSPIGNTTAENFGKIKTGVSGIQQHMNESVNDEPFYASLFAPLTVEKAEGHTFFEQLMIASITDAISKCAIDLQSKRTLLVISSTKGNISLLETEPFNAALQSRMAFTTSSEIIARHFGFSNKPLVVSNACISGIMAILTGMRLIQAEQYDNVVVSGADVITKFILSGFQSFQAISAGPCRPFDINRDGITLGEAAATMILSNKKSQTDDIKVKGGAVSNDANHISAPSRTGSELSSAINKALRQAELAPADIDFISAHGTATIYNDEMEAKAITLSGLQHVPVNSLKAYYGHTLGAAGILESIIALRSLKHGLIIPSLGFKEMGVSTPVNICTRLMPGNYSQCIKTASGFGGGNAAIIFGF